MHREYIDNASRPGVIRRKYAQERAKGKPAPSASELKTLSTFEALLTRNEQRADAFEKEVNPDNSAVCIFCGKIDARHISRCLGSH